MKRIAWTVLALAAIAAAGCESANGSSSAGTPDAQSDLAVGGSDADAADGGAADSLADTATAADTAADSAADAATDAAVADADALAVDGGGEVDTGADTSNPPVPAGGCSAEVTCDKLPGAGCLPPGVFGGCGMCMKPEGPGCSADTECSAMPNGVCELRTDNCLCEKIPLCYEGCTKDDQCVQGQVCGADHHCKVKSCAKDGDCPAQFACQNAQCQRKACTASAQCPGAYCVGGLCFDKAGTCELPKP